MSVSSVLSASTREIRVFLSTLIVQPKFTIIMKTTDFNKIVNYITDYIIDGYEVQVDSIGSLKQVFVREPHEGKGIKFKFTVSDEGDIKILSWDDAIGQKAKKPVKPEPAMNRRGVKPSVRKACKRKSAAAAVTGTRKDPQWWSCFNFEKNIMKMTLFSLQDSYPGEQRFPQQVFAARLARLMKWELVTAQRHIVRAAKMAIINRVVIGTAYYIEGMNDIDIKEAQETVADWELKPGYRPLTGETFDQEADEKKPPYYREFLEEGKPALERQIENAVDETPLP